MQTLTKSGLSNVNQFTGRHLKGIKGRVNQHYLQEVDSCTKTQRLCSHKPTYRQILERKLVGSVGVSLKTVDSIEQRSLRPKESAHGLKVIGMLRLAQLIHPPAWLPLPPKDALQQGGEYQAQFLMQHHTVTYT